MALDNYVDFQAAIADQLARVDLTTQIVDCITLFEAEASNQLFRMRLAEKTTILIPENPAVLTITSIANNGSGLARITVTAPVQSTTITGTEVSIGLTSNYNGTWDITLISPMVFDLQGSTYIATETSGAAQEPQGQVALPSDYLGWRNLTWTGSPEYPLEYVTPDVFVNEYPNSTTPGLTADKPKVFTIEGMTLKIMPVDTTPLELDYFGRNAALSSSLNWLFTNHVDCYWAGTLEQVYSYLKDYNQAGIYQQKKKSCFDEIKTQQFREAGSLRIRPQGFSYGATP